MEIMQVLEKLGLSPNQVKVYMVLNDYGEKAAGSLAKLAKIDRSSCYYSLKGLLEKGLVSYALKGTIRFYQASAPARLLDYVKEQEEDVKAILPELQKRHNTGKAEGQVRLFRGIRGVKSIFLDIIRTGQDNYAYGSEGQLSLRLPEFTSQFNRLKKEIGVKTQLIIRKGRKELDAETSEYRYLEDIRPSPAVTNIYGNKIAIVIWTEEPEAIIIENAAAAQAFRSYFDFMWKHAEK
jgi:HTH-type transcriptional regulator, sugar sensing transcriptional regulator